jgi:hypothetical protein
VLILQVTGDTAFLRDALDTALRPLADSAR